MRLILRNSGWLAYFPALLLLLSLTGCAEKQWRDTLAESEEKAVRKLLQEEQQKMEHCPDSIDADLITTWSSQLRSGSLNGYIQIFLPSSIKVVALNPLNQPIYAFATDGEKFQSINAVKGVYKYGRLSTFMQKYDIPSHLLGGDWGQWLTGGISFNDEQLKELRQDVSLRGTWLTVEKKRALGTAKEYLLYNPAKKLLLQRIIMSPEGNEVASIEYIDWHEQFTCTLPKNVRVSGISFGTTIDVELKDVLTDKTFTKDTFFLKLPPGYVQQQYP